MASSIPAAGEFRSQHNEFQMCPLDTYSHRNLNSNLCRSICTPPACPWCNCHAVLDPENKSICMTAGFDVKSPGQKAEAQLLYPIHDNYYHSNLSSSTFPGHMGTWVVLSLLRAICADWSCLLGIPCVNFLFLEWDNSIPSYVRGPWSPAVLLVRQCLGDIRYSRRWASSQPIYL